LYNIDNICHISSVSVPESETNNYSCYHGSNKN